MPSSMEAVQQPHVHNIVCKYVDIQRPSIRPCVMTRSTTVYSDILDMLRQSNHPLVRFRKIKEILATDHGVSYSETVPHIGWFTFTRSRAPKRRGDDTVLCEPLLGAGN